MKLIVLLLSCLALMSSGVQAGELYRWLDARGAVHYGDIPPAEALQIETLKYSDTATPDEDLSYETRRARQHFPVTLYVAGNCTEFCDQARSLLDKRGIPYNEIMLLSRADIDGFKALSGSDNVPTLAVGRSFLKGFLADRWHGELDIAGYPKIAPYRAAPPVPAPSPTAAPTSQPEIPANPEPVGEATPDSAGEP